jgi:hypothetical protein
MVVFSFRAMPLCNVNGEINFKLRPYNCLFIFDRSSSASNRASRELCHKTFLVAFDASTD